MHCGSELAAGRALATVEELARLSSTPELQGVTAYARAVTRREDAVDARFDRALADCPTDRAFDRARINLARGVCLRRERRVSESRSPLLEALVAFERLGARRRGPSRRGASCARPGRGTSVVSSATPRP